MLRLSQIAIEFGAHLKRQVYSGETTCSKRNFKMDELSFSGIPMILVVNKAFTKISFLSLSGCLLITGCSTGG